MRKLMIKYLALSYRVRLFGKEFTFPRAANVVVPVMLLLGLALMLNSNYPTQDFFTWIMLLVTAVLWAIIIVYLKLFPAKWEELDNEQRWFWGWGIKFGKLKDVLNPVQWNTWHRINNIESNDIRRFYNVRAFLVIPVSLFLFLSIIIFL